MLNRARSTFKSGLRHSKPQALFGKFELPKDFSADATVVGIVNDILKLKHTRKYLTLCNRSRIQQLKRFLF